MILPLEKAIHSKQKNAICHANNAIKQSKNCRHCIWGHDFLCCGRLACENVLDFPKIRPPNCLEKNDPKLFIQITFNLVVEHYNKIRTTARPTADMETRVPMQYLITSYFAASNWAFNA